jgi:hypothetical protein
MGLIIIEPDFEVMSPRELLEQYLKLLRERKGKDK